MGLNMEINILYGENQIRADHYNLLSLYNIDNNNEIRDKNYKILMLVL